MKLLDRYIARELLGPFLFGVGAFTSIFIASQLFFKLMSYLAKGAPLPETLSLLAVKLVPLIVFTFPMAMLLAALLAFGRLSGEQELTAMLSAGIPFLRTAVPAFVAGAAVSALGLAINEWVAPAAGRTAERLERRIIDHLRASGVDIAPPKANRAFVVQDTDSDGQLSRVVVARGLNLATGELRDVTLVQYGPAPGGGRQVTYLVEATRAVWEKGSSWRFIEGRLQYVNPVHRAETRPTAGSRPVASGPRSEVYQSTLRFADMEFKIRKSPRQMLAQQRNAEEMNFGELRETIGYLKEQGAAPKAVRELEVQLYNKLAIPFASMVFALVGSPLGLRRLRGGASVGLGLSILIIFGYYLLWHGMSVLGEGGQVPPAVASWLPNAVGLVAGLVLIRRAPT